MSDIYPKISIVTPTYNSEQFLEATIQSILNQSYPNLEYIIIDGGSTDGTLDIIQKYASHLHYWVSEPDNGMYDAIQKGFQQATGDIMAWLNSDDMYLPWTLKTVSEIFTQLSDIRWLTSSHLLFAGTDGRPNATAVVDGYSHEGLYHREHTPLPEQPFNLEFIQQESTFWRRDLWDETQGLNTTLKYAGETDLWLEFSPRAILYSVPLPLAMFRVHDNQITSALSDAYNDELRAVLSARNIPEQTFYYGFWRGQISKLFPKRLRKLGAMLGVLRVAWKCQYHQGLKEWKIRKEYY